MYIDYMVFETSDVLRITPEIDILQGENNHTILRFSLPHKIGDYYTTNFKQEIKFESEKGDVLRLALNNGEFALNSDITKFKSVKVQLVLTNSIDEAKPIIWRTKVFKLDFVKSINAVKAKGE